MTIVTYHYTKDYSFKYKNIEDIAKVIREMRDAEVDVKNEIKPSSRYH